MPLRTPRSNRPATLFPYSALFRSQGTGRSVGGSSGHQGQPDAAVQGTESIRAERDGQPHATRSVDIFIVGSFVRFTLTVLMTMFKRLLILLATLLGLASVPAQAQLEITVTGGDVSALPIAIVPFAQSPKMTTDIAQVIENDLVRSGRFRALPRTSMQQKPSELAAFDPTPWKAQGMDNVVIGKVWDDGKGGFVVRFFLVDSLSGKIGRAHV